MNNELNLYSNPKQVLKQAKKYIGKDVIIQQSTRKDKKYMILNPQTNKWIHFGQMGFEDYTQHKDLARRHRFRLRNARWKDAPMFSPAFLSYWLLW